jgi:hypothetical protein
MLCCWATTLGQQHMLLRFSKNNLFTSSYQLIPLPIALILSSATSERTAAGPLRHSARPPPRLLLGRLWGTPLGCVWGSDSAAFESWCSAAGPARRGALLASPSHTVVASPLFMRSMTPFCDMQPLLLAYHLQASLGRCLWWTLHTNEPPFYRAARRCCIESACGKSMFQLF